LRLYFIKQLKSCGHARTGQGVHSEADGPLNQAGIGVAALFASGEAVCMIVVEETDTDVRVTIPKGAVPQKQLNAFLDWLRLEEIAQRSGLSEKEADRIAEGIKAEWWAANKEQFIPPSER
jgi:hypothetical protein